MNVLGTRAATSFASEPDIKAWTDAVPLNPAGIPPGHEGSDALYDAIRRMQAHAGPALTRLAELSGDELSVVGA
jgi:hypothetical protein